MDDDLPGHVRDYKLATEFRKKRQIVHFYDDPDAPPSSEQRSEFWKSEKRPIGQGGQGKVYLQNCTSGGRRYTQRAVKVIPLQVASGRRRYIGELETIIKFSHDKYSKYFVKLLGWYESDDSLYIAMEYFPLGDLQTYLGKHAPLPENGACQITSQVLQGLVAMHKEGFAHRDLKPKNILIQQCATAEEPSSWWIKLSDFGITKRLGAVSSGASTLIGTPEYLAPEFLRVDQRVFSDTSYPAADMWALGVMTFFLLTNSYPFTDYWSTFEYTRNPNELFPRRPLDESHVSPDGQSFIRDLVKPEPNERPDSNAATHYKWLWSWLPNAPIILNNRSQSSTSSSGRSSFDEARGMTTEASIITDLPILIQRGITTQLPQHTNPTELSNEVSNDKTSISHFEESSTKGSIQDQAQTPKVPGVADGWKPIHIASKNGQVKVVELLLKRGADINTASKDGWTPLHVASAQGQTELVKFLLQRGAAITNPNETGRTPMHAASKIGSLEVVKLLLENGSDITASTKTGWTPIYEASNAGHTEVVKFLHEKGADITAQTETGWTPINAASYNGFTEIVKFLFENGADITTSSTTGRTPIHSASITGQTEVVKFLIGKGVDVEVMDSKGHTPLYLASEKGHVDVVELLLDAA